MLSMCRHMIRAIDALIHVFIKLCTNSKSSMLSAKLQISALNACESLSNSCQFDESWVTASESTDLYCGSTKLGNPDDPYLKPDDPCQNPAHSF